MTGSFLFVIRRTPGSTLFPYTTLFRSVLDLGASIGADEAHLINLAAMGSAMARVLRSEEHTSELQSLRHLVCRLLLEKKKMTCGIGWILSKWRVQHLIFLASILDDLLQ